MSGLLGLLTGTSTECTGVEDDSSGALRAYVGPRYRGVYVLVEDEHDKEELRHAWAHGVHVIIPMPPADALLVDKAG